MRDWLQRNPVAVVAATALVLALAGWSVFGKRGNPRENQRYFYDLGSGALFLHDVNAIPPVKAPSGGEGVLATVYMCGKCEPGAEPKIAFIETFTPEALALMQKAMDPSNPNPSAMAAAQAQRLIAAPSREPQWMTYDSPVASALMGFANNCPGQKAEICLPK